MSLMNYFDDKTRIIQMTECANELAKTLVKIKALKDYAQGYENGDTDFFDDLCAALKICVEETQKKLSEIKDQIEQERYWEEQSEITRCYDKIETREFEYDY